MRCWWCGAEPLEMVDVSTLVDAEPRLIPGRWPPTTDRHQHAIDPPTPGELEDAGHRALSRIQHEATEMGA